MTAVVGPGLRGWGSFLVVLGSANSIDDSDGNGSGATDIVLREPSSMTGAMYQHGLTSHVSGWLPLVREGGGAAHPLLAKQFRVRFFVRVCVRVCVCVYIEGALSQAQGC